MNTLYTENLDLVRYAVRAVPSWRRDEAAQEARIALWKASESYVEDHESGASFRTYAGHRVRGAALTAALRDSWVRRGRQADYTVTVSQELVLDSDPGAPDFADDVANRADVEAILAQLTPAQARALRLRYLEGFTFAEVAQREGVTASAVHRRVASAIRAARRNSGEQ